MTKVYVLEFSHPDLFDCNGVFSTFERRKKPLSKTVNAVLAFGEILNMKR